MMLPDAVPADYFKESQMQHKLVQKIYPIDYTLRGSSINGKSVRHYH